MCDRAPGNNMENHQIGLEPDISRQPGIEDLAPEKHGPVIMCPGTEKIVPALTTGEPWTCSCGTRNTGKFCTECGSIKPTAVICECGYQSSGKYCPNCGKRLAVKTEEPEKIPEQEITAGWKCSKCGAENQTGDICEKCGGEIRKVLLLSCSSYATTNPPSSEGADVYEFSDTELICEYHNNGKVTRHYISVDLISAAQEIIKKFGIDKWKNYENRLSGMMGGSVYVRYRDGNELVGSSMDHMGSAVVGAYFELMALFRKK